MSKLATILNCLRGVAGPVGSRDPGRERRVGGGLQAALDQAEAMRELRGLDDRRLRDIGVRRERVTAMLAGVGGIARARFALAAFALWLARTDWVILTTAGLFLALALLLPDQFLVSLRFTVASLWYAAPFLLLSAAIVASVSAPGLAHGLKSGPADWLFWWDLERLSAVRRQSLAVGGLLVKWLTLVFLIESLLVAVLAGGALAPWLGGAFRPLMLAL